MKKKKKNPVKKEYTFSKSYEERKKELLDKFFGKKNLPKK